MRLTFSHISRSIRCQSCHRAPAIIQHDHNAPPLCATCYCAGRSATVAPVRWLLIVLAVSALIVVLLVIGAPLGLACVALPPVLCAKCQYCGASTWPGIYICASCRKERKRSGLLFLPTLLLLLVLAVPMGATSEGRCKRCLGWSTNLKNELCPGCRILWK